MGLVLKKTLKKLYRSNQVKIQTGFRPGQVHVRKRVEGLKFKAEFESRTAKLHIVFRSARKANGKNVEVLLHMCHTTDE